MNSSKTFFRIPLKRMDSARSSLQGFSDSKKKILNRWQRTNLEYFPHENITNYMDVRKHIVCFWDYFCYFSFNHTLQSYICYYIASSFQYRPNIMERLKLALLGKNSRSFLTPAQATCGFHLQLAACWTLPAVSVIWWCIG